MLNSRYSRSDSRRLATISGQAGSRSGFRAAGGLIPLQRLLDRQLVAAELVGMERVGPVHRQEWGQ